MDERVKKIMELREKGLSWKEIGAKMGISASTAWRLYRMLNDEEETQSEDDILNQISDLRSKNVSWQEIGQKLGIASSTAWRWYFDTFEDSKKEVVKNKKDMIQDVKKIKVMRRDGYTWENIGDKLGVSPSTAWRWYDEFSVMEEGEVVKKFVEPYLKDKGHSIVTRQDMKELPCEEFNMQIDLISQMNNVYYYSEVKINTENHRLQTAIGQLFSHKFCNKSNPHIIKYQIIFPEDCKSDKCFSSEFIKFLKKQMDIDIMFV
jgi:orotate phosphoribosyltransferase-like protein